MKKFLAKIFVYIVLLSIVMIAVNQLYAANYHDGTERFTRGVPDGIDICNLGSSHGEFSFKYDRLEEKYTCFNFGLSAQSLFYDYRILQNYKGKIKPGAVVFVPISFFSLFGKPDVESGGFASKNKRYYKILPAELIEQYDGKTAFYMKYFPALGTDNLENVLEVFFKKANILKGGQAVNHDIAAQQAMRAYINMAAENIDSDGKRVYKHDSIEALYKIIDLCREIGAIPILVTTPHLHEYKDEIRKKDPKFFDDFYGVIDEVVKNTGVKYFDYSNDERYSSAYELFRDSSHLTEKGGLIFTDDVIKNIAGPYIMR